MENGQGLNHIDSSDPIPPPPPAPLMPPPPPPLIPPDAKGQPDDLLTFKDDCPEPYLKPFTHDGEHSPPGNHMYPLDGMDLPEDPMTSEEPGYGVPLHSQFVPLPVPPPVPEVDSESPTAMELPDPDMENLPPEDEDDEALPPDSLEQFSASGGLRHSGQNYMDYSPEDEMETSHHSFGQSSMDQEVSATEYPPARDTETPPLEPEPEPEPVPVPPAPYEPPKPPELELETEPEPVSHEEDKEAEEEEINPPTWSDEPPVPVVDYPPPGLHPMALDIYPEHEPLQSSQETYPAEHGRYVDAEAPPAYTEKAYTEKGLSEFEPRVETVEEMDAGPYGKDPHQDSPVDVSAMAAASAAMTNDHSPGEESESRSPPATYDINTSPHYMESMGVAEPPREDHVHLPQATTYVIPPQGYDVIDEEQGQTTCATVVVAQPLQKGGGGRCCEKCVGCLSHVPCGSLVAWILLVLGLGALAGSILVGTRKTRNLVHDDTILWFLELTVTGVVVGMFVLGTCFLIVAHLSSEPTCRRLFNSSSRNTCARGLNIFLLVFVYVLFVSWTLLSTILATPVVLLVMIFLVIGRLKPDECLDLKNYGFQTKKICFPELHSFEDDAQDILICYGVALLSAILIVISLVHFLICLSANITHLRDNRFIALSTCEPDEEHNSKHAMMDTNM